MPSKLCARPAKDSLEMGKVKVWFIILCSRVSFTNPLTNSCPGLVANAPLFSAPLESGQRGWGFDPRLGRLWIMDSGFWSSEPGSGAGPLSFFAKFLGVSIGASGPWRRALFFQFNPSILSR